MNNLRFPGGKKKAFTLSFDDGVTDDRRFIGIINRFGLKGTFNLNSYSLTHAGGREKVTVEELGTLYHGHEIAVHTWSHPCPSETFSGNFADGRILYNPTCTKIWYQSGSDVITISPDETVCVDG